MIEISRPFYLLLDVLEAEDKLPSLKMNVICKIPHFGGQFLYQANVWFDCRDWDLFERSIKDLLSADGREATLNDMSNYFTLKIALDNGLGKIKVSFFEPIVLSGEVSLVGNFSTDRESVELIANAFLAFPKWWDKVDQFIDRAHGTLSGSEKDKANEGFP